jgi:hypothetical protein
VGDESISVIRKYWSRTEVGRDFLESGLFSESDLLFLMPNNVRKLHSLPMTRKHGKRGRKRILQRKRRLFENEMWAVIQGAIEQHVEAMFKTGVAFDRFASIQDFPGGDRTEFYKEEDE